MPFYSFRCSNGHLETHYSKIAARDDVRQCDQCGANLRRLLEAPYIRPELQAYTSPIDGRWINSRAQRTEDLRRNNCIEYDPEMRKELPARQAEIREKAAAPLDACIEKTARELVASGKLSPL